MSRAVTLALAALSGVLVFLAFPGWNLHYLAWFAYVPLLIACRDSTPRQGFAIGLFAGTITNIGGFHWMTTLLTEFGHMGWLPAWAILMLQAVTQGLCFAVGIAVWRWLVRRGASPGFSAFLGLWLGEALIPMLFPWFLGNAISRELPMIQIADLGGVSLVSAMLYAANASIAELILAVLARRRPAVGLLLGTGLGIALAAGYGLVRLPDVDAMQAAAPKLRIGMVEGNIGIWEKEAKHLDPDARALTLQHNLLIHQQMSADLARRGAELIVWPESAYQPFGPNPVLHTTDHFLAVGEGGAVWRHDGKLLHADAADRHGLPLDLGLLTGLSSPRGDIWRVLDRGRSVWTVTPKAASHVELPVGQTAVTTVTAPVDLWGRVPSGYVIGRSGRVWELPVAGYQQDDGKRTDPAKPAGLQEKPAELHELTGTDLGPFDATSAAVNGAGTVAIVGRGGGVLVAQQGRLRRAGPTNTTADLWAVAGDQQGLLFVAVGAGGTVVQGDGDAWSAGHVAEGDLYAAWFAQDGTAWVAGQKGTLLRRQFGGGWHPVPGLPAVDLLAGASDADGNVLVAGRGGRLFYLAGGKGPSVELNSGQRGEITALLGFQAQASFYVPRSSRRILPARTPLPDANLKFPEDVRSDESTPELERNTPRRGFQPALLFGALTHGSALPSRSADCTDCYNSAILLGSQGEILSIYDKAFLLMFGEYIPFGEEFPQLYDLSPETSRFQSGTRTDPVLFGKARIGVLICYEDLIPRYARRVAAHDPNVFINMTNDAWFGKTAEPEHHLNLALMRAVEYRRWLLRSTNTGISVFIDAAGRRVQETSLDGAETLLRDVPLLESRTVYARLGDWPLLLLGLALLVTYARTLGQGPRAKGKPRRRKV
jgi:apolipoprotein N-acyltransferase